MNRFLLPAVLTAVALGGLLATPAHAQSCPNENFALIPADTDFLASKDRNENDFVCRGREFVMPPPGYPTPFIVIDDLG